MSAGRFEGGRRVVNSNSVTGYMVKLKRMVPTARGQSRINKLELLQHVIDYIHDLEVILGSEQSTTSPEFSPPKTSASPDMVVSKRR